MRYLCSESEERIERFVEQTVWYRQSTHPGLVVYRGNSGADDRENGQEQMLLEPKALGELVPATNYYHC